MCSDVVIDPGETGKIFCDVKYPLSIAVFGKTGVNQHRLTKWRHDQSRRTTFNVDEIDIESFRCGMGKHW